MLSPTSASWEHCLHHHTGSPQDLCYSCSTNLRLPTGRRALAQKTTLQGTGDSWSQTLLAVLWNLLHSGFQLPFPKAAFLNLPLRTSIPLPAIRPPVYLTKIKVLRHKSTQLLHTSYKLIYSCILPHLVFSVSEGKGSFLVPNPIFAVNPITSSHDHPLPSSKKIFLVILDDSILLLYLTAMLICFNCACLFINCHLIYENGKGTGPI